MSTNEIKIILEKLDTLEDKIDSLDEVHIINGGGREITYKRAEFFQMLHDWRKEGFFGGSNIAKGLSYYFDVVIKIASIIAIFYTAINLGGK